MDKVNDLRGERTERVESEKWRKKYNSTGTDNWHRRWQFTKKGNEKLDIKKNMVKLDSEANKTEVM